MLLQFVRMSGGTLGRGFKHRLLPSPQPGERDRDSWCSSRNCTRYDEATREPSRSSLATELYYSKPGVSAAQPLSRSPPKWDRIHRTLLNIKPKWLRFHQFLPDLDRYTVEGGRGSHRSAGPRGSRIELLGSQVFLVYALSGPYLFFFSLWKNASVFSSSDQAFRTAWAFLASIALPSL